ncbi:MAG: baseplate J/gp47 family protein, partial [Oscillibacter sp.]
RIAAGTVCMTADELRFETTAAAVLAAGTLTVDAAARALEPGKRYNAVAGSVGILTACPVGITACTNPAAFSGGSDAEEDEALRARILESYQRLPNGANAAYYEQTAMGHSDVAAARAVGRARGIGTVDVYVATQAGIPSAQLLAAVQADLQEKREIAVDVQALAPTKATVNLSVELTVAEGAAFAAVKAAVERALGGFFTGRLLGCPLRLAELGRTIFAVEGVENYHILSPTADLPGNNTVLPTLGTLGVTEMGGA